MGCGVFALVRAVVEVVVGTMEEVRRRLVGEVEVGEWLEPVVDLMKVGWVGSEERRENEGVEEEEEE